MFYFSLQNVDSDVDDVEHAIELGIIEGGAIADLMRGVKVDLF